MLTHNMGIFKSRPCTVTLFCGEESTSTTASSFAKGLRSAQKALSRLNPRGDRLKFSIKITRFDGTVVIPPIYEILVGEGVVGKELQGYYMYSMRKVSGVNMVELDLVLPTKSELMQEPVNWDPKISIPHAEEC